MKNTCTVVTEIQQKIPEVFLSQTGFHVKHCSPMGMGFKKKREGMYYNSGICVSRCIDSVPISSSPKTVQFSSVQLNSIQFSSVQFSSVLFNPDKFSSVQFNSA